ncbi:unnamed protein product, partial [Closterium sp. NIES-54]
TIESAAALGASESSVAGASKSVASAEALHTFTLDSGASRCFFRDCTTLTPLAAPVPVSLANPTGGPVVARASTVILCPAVLSCSLSGLHLPMFSTKLVSNAALQDVWVDTFTPRGQRVAICTCSRTGRHLATFTRRPRSSLYTLTTASAQVAESGQVTASSQVSASGQLAASCSCRVLSHQTLLWHHRLEHPSLPRLRSMHSRLLVSGLPRSQPSLLRSPAPPCLPCVEGRQRAAPHSSDTPPLHPHRLTGKSCPPLPRPPDRRPSPVPLHRPPPPPPPRPRSPPQFQQPKLHPPSASPSSPSLPRPASGSSQGASSAWTSTPPVPLAIRSRTLGAISASAPPDARCRALHAPRT